jgi:small subunit ribosomal protein S35
VQSLRAAHTSCRVSASSKEKEVILDDEEFRVLVIPGHTKVPERKQEARFTKREVPPPRYKSMKLGEDWTNIWPAAHSFKWSVVPFPVRQGYVEKSENDGIPPSKYANAELMKIPNFLHLTPSHVKKHCAALKDLCTEWPAGLTSDADCEAHFPIEVVTRDYVADSASVRDARARPVTVKIKLSSLDLDCHARDKLIRLAGSCYNAEIDTLVLETDRCPLKKQNYDHAMYLLTALYTESWKTESWESEKTLADMEKYFWNLNPSKTTIVRTLRIMKQKSSETKESGKIPLVVQKFPDGATDDQIVDLPLVKNYERAVMELFNEGEDIKSVERYKEVVKQLLLNANVPIQTSN